MFGVMLKIKHGGESQEWPVAIYPGFSALQLSTVDQMAGSGQGGVPLY